MPISVIFLLLPIYVNMKKNTPFWWKTRRNQGWDGFGASVVVNHPLPVLPHQNLLFLPMLSHQNLVLLPMSSTPSKTKTIDTMCLLVSKVLTPATLLLIIYALIFFERVFLSLKTTTSFTKENPFHHNFHKQLEVLRFLSSSSPKIILPLHGVWTKWPL